MASKNSVAAIHPRAGEFLELMATKYRDDAVGFAEDVLGLTMSPNQQEPAMSALANPDGKKSIAVVSGHGTGKSFMESVIILWFLVTRPNARIVLTAPTARQIYDVLMAEVNKLYHSSPLYSMNILTFTKDRIRINIPEYSASWFASAVSVSNPEAFSGSHAEDILMIFDEGAGVPSEIFERSEGVLTTEGSYMVTCGNPSFTSGYFYDIFHNENYAKTYDLFTFNAEDSPNVEDDWIEMMGDKYGKDSNVYKVRVLGVFAPMDEEIIIRREDARRAIGRQLVKKGDTNKVAIGVDVSSGKSNDFSVISVRRGNEEVERIRLKEELRTVKNHIIILVSKYLQTSDDVVVNVDTTGLGVQMGQDLADHYYYKDTVEINEINFSSKAMDSRQFNNIATEMLFQLADQIEDVSFLDGMETSGLLEEELGSRQYGYDNQGRYQAERKKDWIKRFGRSPDVSDAVALAFYERRNFMNLTERYYDRY